MNGHRVDGTVVSALRLCLVVLGLGAFVGQTLYVPVAASQSAQASPELAYLAVPYAVAVVVVVVVACVLLTVLVRGLPRSATGACSGAALA